MWCRSHDLLAQVRKKGGDLRHWNARKPDLRSRSPGEKHTCADSPLHLRQCGEEQMTSEDEIPPAGGRRYLDAARGGPGNPFGIMQPSVLRTSCLFSLSVVR